MANAFKIAVVFALGLSLAIVVTAQDPGPEIKRLTAYFEKWRGARYMEQNCKPTTYPNYNSSLPLKLCNYTVRDSALKTDRHALVILLDAEPAQLARWVVHAVLTVKKAILPAQNDVVAKQIIEASGAQFPVAGVVFEDMDGTGQRVFPFRHGVTVEIAGLPYYETIQPTNAQLQAYLTGNVTVVKRFARIQSTTREQYVANGGDPAVLKDTSLWPGIIRKAYSAAWNNDNYELLVAWARGSI